MQSISYYYCLLTSKQIFCQIHKLTSLKFEPRVQTNAVLKRLVSFVAFIKVINFDI